MSGPPLDYGSLERLFEDSRLFIQKHVELENSGYYDVATGFVLGTWRYSSFRAFPYLWAVAPPGSGKSTLLETLNEIVYRGSMSGTISVAGMSRMIHSYGCSVLCDEAQVNEDPKEKSELQALFNVGYRQSGRRTIASGGGDRTDWTPKFLNVYSPKVMGSTHVPWEALGGRCLIFKMTKTERKDLKPTLTRNFNDEGFQLRSRLLKYRFDHLTLQIPERLASLDDSVNDARLREISLPLLTVAPTQAHQNILIYLRALEEERNAEEETSEEAAYVQTIKNLENAGPLIPIKEIRKALLDPLETEERYLPSPKTITQNLKALGFNTTKHSGSNRTLRGIVYDAALMKRLTERYIRSEKIVSGADGSLGADSDDSMARTGPFTCQRCKTEYPSLRDYHLAWQKGVDPCLQPGEIR